ncbi:MAG: hypothetical protein HW391_820 [Chloroflexi bacterium]|nr:hypothetical protein [Chloroflexota bacterium]
MFTGTDQGLRLAHDRIDRLHRQAAEERLADQARHRHRLSLRQRTARRLIQLGERLAAEPAIASVQPRRVGRTT